MATVSRGIRAPIIRSGDDIVAITVDSVLNAAETSGFVLHDRDIIAVTEAVVARADGNYATIDDIAADVQNKLGRGHIGLVFPILSRNRFSVCLRGIARGADKITLILGYPSDEVGNHLVDPYLLEEKGVNPWTDVLTSARFYEICGECRHPFTGVDYIEFYKSLIEAEGCEAEIVFANRPETVLNYTDKVLCCDTHTRERTRERIRKHGGNLVLTLCDIMNSPVNGSGCNPEYGLLGSNKSTEDSVKLFPKNSREVAYAIQDEIMKRTGVHVEAMVYGDGAFKDPVGKIWELADPVVSPGYTDGLYGLPNELKLKFLADNDYSELSGQELAEKIRSRIREKNQNLKGSMLSQGTTPRMLTDLIGSLCDLTSGSGDKGTPIVLVQDYFTNYAD
ncbi:MAG TPA: coenzyme F420-0:L-glutamate ligase [Eubacteriales bacterium]|nr:coenzyme F420-0:L-glutamate ligase [Clostridia bacterium]HRV72664.1 coenzyme F420-0:L-glutamate ligase [Eubacteriales bacterium]